MRRRSDVPSLTVDQVVSWALDHFVRTGRWPMDASGPVHGQKRLTWSAISSALYWGYRDLPKFSSIGRLLDHYLPDVRAASLRPNLTFTQIRKWARDHHERTGRWPAIQSGEILGTDGETWTSVNHALMRGTRGLPGGTTLPRLLGKVPGSVMRMQGKPLTVRAVLLWAREHFDRHGTWPTVGSGEVSAAPGETWLNINACLKSGFRGLPGGTTLSRLLGRTPGSRRNLKRPALTLKIILDWADAHHQRYRTWPTEQSGHVRGAPGEHWKKVARALRSASRGLPDGWSLPRLLHERRGVPMILRNETPLTEKQILAWADAHHRRTGDWPTGGSGPVFGVRNEDWRRIRDSLFEGSRGLPGGSSLARLLAKHRGVPHQKEGLRPKIRPFGRGTTRGGRLRYRLKVAARDRGAKTGT